MTVEDVPYAPITGPFVAVVCDDQGRHRPRRVARFGQRAGEWVSTRDDTREPGDPVRGGVTVTVRGWRLVCPVCGRDVRVRADTLTPVLDGLMSVQADTVSLAGLASRI